MHNKTKALSIAKNALNKCYKKEGIVAGATHFNYFWARDSFFASWGALELKNYKIVKRNLETFIKYQKENGQIPIRIGASSVMQWVSILIPKIKTKTIGVYNQDKGFNPAIDPNLLFIITIQKYVEKTKDFEFAKKNLIKIHKAMDWLETFEKEGLIYAGKYSTWQDAIKKEGYSLYTNVLYYEAIKSLNKLLNSINIKNEFEEKSKIIKEKINEKFYDEKLGYYIDFFNSKQRCEVFSPDGNFFAILFDVSNKKQTDSILKIAEKFEISKEVPSYTNSPKYKKNEVYLPLFLVNMQGYHNNNICWPWIGCLHVIALNKVGKYNESKKILEKISTLISSDNDIYEVYERNGKPVKRFFYKSEKQFAWGAGFFILANKTVN